MPVLMTAGCACARCVIPVLMQSRRQLSVQLPFGLRSLKPINASQIINGRSLADYDRHSRPDMSDVDALFLSSMTLILNERLHLKLLRKEKQQKELDDWIRTEQQRRYMEMERETRNIEREDRRRQHEYEQHKRRLDIEQVNICQLNLPVNK